MVKLFKHAQPVALLILAIYTLLLNFNLYIETPALQLTTSAPFSQFFDYLLQPFGNSSVLLVTIFLVLMLAQALILNNIIDRHKILDTATALPAFCYVLLLSLFNESVFMSSPFFANFALLFALDRIVKSYDEDSFTHPFDIGLAISIGSLIFLPIIVFVVFMFMALAITRILNWREWVTCLMGASVPYILLGTYYFVTEQFWVVSKEHFLWSGVMEMPVENYIALIIKSLTLISVILLSIYFLQTHFLKIIVRTRKFLTILVYWLTFSLFPFLFLAQLSLQPVAIMFIPLSIFLAYSFFEIKDERINEFIHLLIIGNILLFQYLPLV